jgi:hypothetical protein
MFAKELEAAHLDADSMSDGKKSLQLESFMKKKFQEYDKDNSGSLETSECNGARKVRW